MAPLKFVLFMSCLFDLMESHAVIGKAANVGSGGRGHVTHLAPVEPIDWTSPLTLGLVGSLILLIVLTCFICFQRGCPSRSTSTDDQPPDKPHLCLTPNMLKKSRSPLTPIEVLQLQKITGTGTSFPQKYS